MKYLTIIITISLFTLTMVGCSTSFSVSTNSPSTTKAASTNTSTTTGSTKPSNTTNSKVTKPKLKGGKKPEGESKKVQNNPVPDSWLYLYDSQKGYGFYVPDGTAGEIQNIQGFDVMSVTTPAPSEIDIFVLVYKDKTLTKDDLLNDAVDFLEGLGQKVTPGQMKDINEDYAVADAATTHPERGKGKLRILVGTDVTDNYVMILGTDEAKFAPNEKIIDEIVGSFEMWSGGASGNS